MKKGMALEGYIVEDKTVRPMKHYDDTELREKIQTNTDEIDNLKSKTDDIDDRVEYLEQHGGAEDPTKADKVAEAAVNNFASLTEDGNIQDSGFAPDDFAENGHTHYEIKKQNTTTGSKAVVDVDTDEDGGYVTISLKKGSSQTKTATIDDTNISNLIRALATPSSTPEDDATKLITSKAVYDALQEAEGLTVDSALSSSSTNPVQNKAVYDAFAGKMDKLPEVELRFDSQDGYTMHAHVDNLISVLSAGSQFVAVKCMIDTADADNIVNVMAIGSVHIFNTEQDYWEIELLVGETLFGTSFRARDTQEAEEAIDSMFEDYGAGARVYKMNVTLFPSVS